VVPAAGMWVTGTSPSLAQGHARAAWMIMSAVAWAAWWAVSGRTLNGGVRYSNCRNARLGGGVQPPDSLPFLDALWKEPQAARTFQRADPASEGMTLEMCLVRQPPSGGAERYCDPTVTC
jgi:hypothetical protein